MIFIFFEIVYKRVIKTMSEMYSMFKTKFIATFPGKELPDMDKGVKGYYNDVFTLGSSLLSYEDAKYYMEIENDLSELIDEDKVFFIVGATIKGEDPYLYTCGGMGSYAYSMNMLVYLPTDDKFYIYSNMLCGDESCDGPGGVINHKIHEYDDWVKLPGNEAILEKILLYSKFDF
jgi:hypothetical protein